MILANPPPLSNTDINRIEKDDVTPPLKSRILVLSVSGETSAQYIPIMNCIFAAQKAVSDGRRHHHHLGDALALRYTGCRQYVADASSILPTQAIPIDVCQIYGKDTVFLQQAAHLTKASYYRLERRSGFLQYLLMAFLPGPAIRKHLHLPTQEQIDLRAACFCHKKIVDIGYVCSVCLSSECLAWLVSDPWCARYAVHGTYLTVRACQCSFCLFLLPHTHSLLPPSSRLHDLQDDVSHQEPAEAYGRRWSGHRRACPWHSSSGEKA